MAEALRSEGRLFALALMFLTALPVPRRASYEPDWMRHGARYFPLVGLVIGVLAATCFLAARQLWPAPIAAPLALAASLMLTGALHEDGFADCADGLLCRAEPARRLEIMKDPRLGTFGTLALILLIALKTASLIALGDHAATALIIAHGLARVPMVPAMAFMRYAGRTDLSSWRPADNRPTVATIAIALTIGIGPALILAPSIVCIAFSLGAALVIAWLAQSRIGGQTGDVLGAMEQAGEVGCLLGWAIFA